MNLVRNAKKRFGGNVQTYKHDVRRATWSHIAGKISDHELMQEIRDASQEMKDYIFGEIEYNLFVKKYGMCYECADSLGVEHLFMRV